MSRLRQVNFLIVLGLFAAITIPSYWVLWFLAPEWIQVFTPASQEFAPYVTFEQAFLLADGWLTLCALIGSLGLLRGRQHGILWMLLTGSSAIFLGLMDLLYDLQHGVFRLATAGSLIELAIVVLVLGLGSTVIVMSWRLRDHFANGAT